MGGSSSTEEQKEVDATGTINNNIILKNTDHMNVESTQFGTFILIAIICGIKILELLLFIYFKHRRGLKKSYISSKSDVPWYYKVIKWEKKVKFPGIETTLKVKSNWICNINYVIIYVFVAGK